MKKANGDSDELLRLAAQLYYVDGLEERDVAKIVGVSRSTVSRLLLRSRQRGIVRFSVDAYEPRNGTLEDRLKAGFHLNHVVVVKTPNARTTADIRRTLGYFAAPHIASFIRPQSVVGVSGGRSVAELIQSIASPKDPQGITVVQLMGNIGPNVTGVDAIELCRTLAQRFGGTFYTINAPAFAPDITTRDVFLNHEDVRSIWQLFDRMNTAFVGIGTLRDSVFIERGILEASDLTRLREQGIVGEICGRFYDANGAECGSDYCNRVISMDLATLRQIKEVVAVTNGPERAQAVVAALKGRIVKSLIIDEAGAAAILQQEDSP